MAGSECQMPPESVHGAGLGGGEQRSGSCQGPGDNEKWTVLGSRKECRKYRADPVRCYFPMGPASAFMVWSTLGLSSNFWPQRIVSGSGGPRVFTSPFPDHRVRIL